MSDWDSWWKKRRINNRLFLFVKKITTWLKVRLIRKMLRDTKLIAPNILELGAGSGMTTMALLRYYKGKATLVDSSQEAKYFFQQYFNSPPEVEYLLCNVSELETTGDYDLVVSDGVISLLPEKQLHAFMKKHVQFVKKNGVVMIIVPRQSFYIHLRNWLLRSDLLYKLILKKNWYLQAFMGL